MTFHNSSGEKRNEKVKENQLGVIIEICELQRGLREHYVMECTDGEQHQQQSFSNVGSPEAPNVDAHFVAKHNFSAEIYQVIF
ncbi:unnamed protein product [Gongylonema pulchrum]|uniref:Uncharacterized protein n=1 Tax=Gongylonema pulchrum TaxID=637853 RepID=A0A183ELB3_9BILA|nr:unnamed protein product [Gongylonema pulchrum]